MKSPFPSMDPYLEHHWGDIHQRLITYICDDIQPKLPRDLFARTGERVYLSIPQSRDFFPDVRIVSEQQATYGVIEEPPPVEEAVEAVDGNPLLVPVDIDDVTENFVEVVDAKTEGQVITVIEVLSLSNKVPGNGWDKFSRKRGECVYGGVNFVEIDLLRDGERNLTASEERIPESHRTPYRICVWRATRPDTAELYGVPLRARIPKCKIPLRAADSDVVLDLQPLLDRCYENGRYERIDYTKEPLPPLSADDAKWADALSRAAKLRA